MDEIVADPQNEANIEALAREVASLGQRVANCEEALALWERWGDFRGDDHYRRRLKELLRCP